MQMRDVFGNELAVGDEVAVIVAGYSILVTGTVLRLTKKMVAVEVPKRWGLGGVEERMAYPNQMVKRT